LPEQPNILFLMTDQMQGRVLEPGHPCLTPNIDRLAARGMRFRRAYTPNAVCSPARASLMTGLLPHNHGVLEVTHVVDDDQCCLRLGKPHWAERLVAKGYRTGYFGKWHVERSEDLVRFGWQQTARDFPPQKMAAGSTKGRYLIRKSLYSPPGYQENLFYAVTQEPPEQRRMGLICSSAGQFLAEVLEQDQPWCCFVSVPEPHDPFVAGREAVELYDVDRMPLADNVYDNLEGRPGIYRKAAQVWEGIGEYDKKMAATCYYASITEIDGQFGRLIDAVEAAGQLENTVVALTADHGELLGAHGLYCKNFSAYEEIYNIPLVMAGRGIAAGKTTDARVGLHDLCPTLLDLVDAPPIEVPDCRSFLPVLGDPEGEAAGFATGYAEYHGGRYRITQRIFWDGPWKFALNGFDFDELYNLDTDPGELHNLAGEPAYQERVREMMAGIWQKVHDTGDRSLWNSHYPILRVAPYGPRIIEE
jgi:choline-sulfatase